MVRKTILLLAVSFNIVACGQKPYAAAPRCRRHSPSDLEVVSLDTGNSPKPTLFLSRAYLGRLPKTSFPLRPDENFPKFLQTRAIVTGIDLDILLKAVAPRDRAASLVAVCRDGYASPFPRPAIQDHHPILVLTIDGLTPHAWALKHHTYDPGPFFVTYANFVPSFKLLAHEDFPQHPAEVIRLKIIPSTQLFAAITPPTGDQLPPDSPILTGFHIAQQNCFRCHNSGDTGGTKANHTWRHLSEVAKSRPDYFAAWVHNPQAVDPHARMTPNLKYDQTTLNALARYFQSLTP